MTNAILGHFFYFVRDFSFYLTLVFLSFLVFSGAIYFVYRSKARGVFHKASLSVTFAFLIFVLVFSSCEAYFRYVYDKSDTLGFLKVNAKWIGRHVKYFKYKEHYLRTKPFSFEKPPGTTRIGVMGDSIAFGAGIKKPEDRFSDLLEKKLQSAGYKTQVINLAKTGYDTNGEIMIYDEVKDLDFDILVWSYYLNDIEDQFNSPGQLILKKNSQRARVLNIISDTSFFLDYVYWRITSTHTSTINELGQADINAFRNPERLAAHYSDIRGFVEDLKSDNVMPVVMIFPYFSQIGPNYPAYNIHKTVGNIFMANGVEAVDLLVDLKDKNAKSLWASNFDPHPNEYVHEIAAKRLFEKVVPLVEQLQNKNL